MEFHTGSKQILCREFCVIFHAKQELRIILITAKEHRRDCNSRFCDCSCLLLVLTCTRISDNAERDRVLFDTVELCSALVININLIHREVGIHARLLVFGDRF